MGTRGTVESLVIRYTLVCVECHAGWEQNEKTGKCPHCGKTAQVRGAYAVVPVEWK